jgi:hypothetical protein
MQNFNCGKIRPHVWAKTNLKKLPKVNNYPKGRQLAQSGHPAWNVDDDEDDGAGKSLCSFSESFRSASDTRVARFFLLHHNGKIITNDQQIYQMAVKRTK